MLHTIISGITKLAKDSEGLLESFSSIEYSSISTDSELKNTFNTCDVFWFRLNHKITKEIVSNSRCKYILCAATGLDHIDLEACKENDIIVVSLKGETEFLKEVRATAEHTLCLLLTLMRKTKNAFRHVETGNWNRYAFQGFELYKKKSWYIWNG
jgi:D-3-phosphoglycerate dehydrogenase